MDRLLAFVNRLPVAAIAVDTEFSNARPEVDLGQGRTWSDPRSILPLLMSAAIWIPDRNRVVRVAIDLRTPEVVSRLPALFRRQTVFVAHFLQAELHTFWALGIDPILHQIWDTHVAAKALDLGAPPEPGRHALTGLCIRYGIDHPYAAAKDQLQQSFLDHPAGTQFNALQVDYALADAGATLRIYQAQQPAVLAAGLHAHLHQVEFPFAEANARMIWDGVPVDRERLADLRDGLDRAIGHHKRRLAAAGLANPRSSQQVRAFLKARGLGERLVHQGKDSTEDAVLERIEGLDPFVTDIRRHRRYASLRADPFFEGTLFGADGRLHPQHRHLGAATGRNTCSAPNIVSISKTFRPVVAAPEGRALVEFDFAQIEVCVAAAVHDDPDLLVAANSSDVYAAMAKIFFVEDLTDDERRMDTGAFKRTRPDLRDKMKTFVLAVIYNMTEQGIADRFGVTLAEARRQRAAFFSRFPGLEVAKRQAEEDGAVRGFAPIIGGLRREIAPGPKAANQHANTPVQGAAAVIFRKAVVDLHRHFRGTGTHLVLPVHDAVLIECDQGDIDQVAVETALIMQSAVRAYFPGLKPRVDVNQADPSCWNKEGRSDSLQRFLEDPDFKL